MSAWFGEVLVPERVLVALLLLPVLLDVVMGLPLPLATK
jgi:hypothetical protein